VAEESRNGSLPPPGFFYSESYTPVAAAGKTRRRGKEREKELK
jgi:hypothetical protein